MHLRTIVHSKTRWWIVPLSIILTCPVWAHPGPNEVFREYTWTRGNSRMQLIFGHPSICTHPQCPHQTPPVIRLEGVDLDGALRAEVVVEYWSGHVGTSGKAIAFNGHAFIDVPMPENTPGDPECFYVVSNAGAVEVPLSHLKQGRNQFTFRALKQICYDFDYPAWGITGVVLRIFFPQSEATHSGSIISPVPGAQLALAVPIEVQTTGAVDKVELLADHTDFDWEGDGLFRQWHHRYTYTKFGYHLGTATSAPYKVDWDTSHLPDQDGYMRLMARITGADGTIITSGAVGELQLVREHSIEMIAASEVPENFKSRTGETPTCILQIDDLSDVVAARLIVSAGAPHEEAGEFGLNNSRLAWVDADSGHAFHQVEVPLNWLHPGENTFYILSHTTMHAMEINWPGPVLLLERPVEVIDPEPDGGTEDAGTDAGTEDAGTDAGTEDAGTDAGTEDAGTEDAGIPDGSDDKPGDDAHPELDLPALINCGSNDIDPEGWEPDDPWVSGGADWTNPDPVDTTGVAGAAPAVVYRSVRHQSPHAYSFPVPNGRYVVRIHFADAFDIVRHMDYTIEGLPVLSDFDVVTEAGGINRALAKEFLVEVADGDGLQIEASSQEDVFEAGFEIWIDSQQPEPDGYEGPDCEEEGPQDNLDGDRIQRRIARMVMRQQPAFRER